MSKQAPAPAPSIASLADDFKGIAPVLRKLAALPDLIDGLAAVADEQERAKRDVEAAKAELAGLKRDIEHANATVAAQRQKAAQIIADADIVAAQRIADAASTVSQQMAQAQEAIDAKKAELVAAEEARASVAAEVMAMERRKEKLDEAMAEMRSRAATLMAPAA
jgi:chromosome segregation ATPase